MLPHVIDQRAQVLPEGAFGKIPIRNAYQNGYRTVTNRELATAINYVASLIQDRFGRSATFDTIAYIGPSDLRYTIVLNAAIKVGYKTFLPSPRNSKEAHLALLGRLECSRLIETSPAEPCISVIVESVSLERLVIPTLDDLLKLDASKTQYMPFTKTYEEAKLDPIFVLHTSGSTGTPKPLTYTHECIQRIWNVERLCAPPGYQYVNEMFHHGSYLITLPPFHIAGLGFTMIMPSVFGGVPIYPVTGAPPTLKAFLDVFECTEMDWAFLPPIIVDEIGKDAILLETLAKKLKYMFFTGGAVPKRSGDAIAQRMGLYMVMGSSECAAIPLVRSLEQQSRPQDWHYIQTHPAMNAEFQHRYGEAHEMVVVRRGGKGESVSEPDGEDFQAVFTHFDIDAFATRDLFHAHPQLPNLWSHVGRLDDIVVFLNGEKTNPVTFEEELTRHPEIRHALLVGEQRFEASLLVEPTTPKVLSEKEKADLITRLWPTVQDANTRCPRHARVMSRRNILIAEPNMLFAKAAKGTVQRQATLNIFANRIFDHYTDEARLEKADTKASAIGPLEYDRILQTVRDIVMENIGHKIADDVDIFSTGMDSLQVVQVRRSLQRKFPTLPISTMTVYDNPSIVGLSEALEKASVPSKDAGVLAADKVSAIVTEFKFKIDSLAGEARGHHALFPKVLDSTTPWSSKTDTNPSQREKIILLTGSTGALGSHVLYTLWLRSDVAKIYCLNRAEDSQSLQLARNSARGLPVDLPSSRVTFITGDLTQAQFGLSNDKFKEMQESVTEIIHNAWPVDFNKSLVSFQHSLEGVFGLIAFATNTDRLAQIMFLSSIASVSNYQSDDSVPERIIEDSSVGVGGYGQSKHIAERILDYASHKLNINVLSVRIGQVAGDAKRQRGWNQREWFPSLIISSVYLRALPVSLGKTKSGRCMNWLPMDQLASILVELATKTPQQSSSRVFHATHPRPGIIEQVLDHIRLNLETEHRLSLESVSYSDWVERLKTTASQDVSAANPAVKLLDFYEMLNSSTRMSPDMEITRTLAASEALRTAQPLQMECFDGWVREWIATPNWPVSVSNEI